MRMTFQNGARIGKLIFPVNRLIATVLQLYMPRGNGGQPNIFVASARRKNTLQRPVALPTNLQYTDPTKMAITTGHQKGWRSVVQNLKDLKYKLKRKTI